MQALYISDIWTVQSNNSQKHRLMTSIQLAALTHRERYVYNWALILSALFAPHALIAAIFDPVDCFEHVNRPAGHRRQGTPEDQNKISLTG